MLHLIWLILLVCLFVSWYRRGKKLKAAQEWEAKSYAEFQAVVKERDELRSRVGPNPQQPAQV